MRCLKTVLAMGLLIAGLPVVAAPAPSSIPRVRVEGGELQGTLLPTGEEAFLGIPYAAPPVREQRWRDPQPASHWRGTFHADRYGPQCPQPQRGMLTNSYSGAEVTSEDCLYLNIWAKPGLKKAPVIVYIHGGAFFIGSASMPMYGGAAIAREGAIFVNFNYRLGVLGMMAHPELSKESPHGTSGNYAFLDQIAALKWIKRNIAQFGGDPDNVTIAGQSAGSMSVNMLQASPLARGLFQRAVGMSGSLLEGPSALLTMTDAEKQGINLQTFLKAGSLADLRAMPADRLMLPRSANGPKIGPVVDGYVVAQPVEQVFAEGKQADVPLILGFTRDESFGGIGPVADLSDYKTKVQKKFGSRAAKFLALYPADDDAQARAQARLADRDGTMAVGMDAWANAQVRHGKMPVFAYEFARVPPFTPGAVIEGTDVATAGAYHTSEVPFWLGTLDSFNLFRQTRDWTGADRAMSLAMTKALVSFARTGRPQAANVDWDAYAPDRRNLIRFGETMTVGMWPSAEKLDFFRSVTAERAEGRVGE